MNTRSVRFRLTVWYSLSFFIATFVIFATFYLITRQALFTQIDTTLTSHGNKVVEVIGRTGQEMHQMMAKQAFITEFSEIPGMLLILMDSGGKIVSSSLNVDSSNAAFTELFETARSKKESFFRNQTLEEISLRFYVSPILLNNKLAGVVLIGHPTDVIERALTNLQVLLGVVFVVFIIPTIIGGSLLARGATQPIVEMSNKLKKITSENLDERVVSPETGDEIEELATTFNDLLDRLNQSFKRERQFIGDVAHELKTPLSTQRSNFEITLSKKRTKDDYKEAIKEALVDNNRIATTLKNILDLAWSEEELAAGKGEAVNFSEIVSELIDLSTKMALFKHINIAATVEKNINVLGKHDKLFRAILNIIDNAIKYTPDKGSITISLHKNQQEAVLVIKDSGIGISQKDLPHIFERFYRGTKTDMVVGSGLGLAIARGIILAHRGKIEVKSKVGKGTSFTIFFPLI